MPSTARCSTPPHAALMIAMLWLVGCGMAGSDAGAPCPPVIDHIATDEARAAEGIEALPEGAVIVGMLAGHAALRDRARACR